MYIPVCTYLYVHTYMYISVCYIRIYVCICGCIFTCMYAHVYKYIHSVAGATKANYIPQLLYNYNKRHFGLLL